MGHSYFCASNGTKLNEEWYRTVIDTDIAPLVREYRSELDSPAEVQIAALLA